MVFFKGYEDSASGSDDDAVEVMVDKGVNKKRARKSTKPTNLPSSASYSIKPVERVKGKTAEGYFHTKVNAKVVDDEESDDLLSKETSPRLNITQNSNKSLKKIKEKSIRILDLYSFNTVIVVDYDMTLVDRNARPFPGAKDFLRKLYNFNNGRVTLVLYSHATFNHIQHGMSTHFAEESEFFTETITDHTMLRNKPVTQVRRVLSNLEALSGPFVIIDDVRSNLDDDQYDITIDVSRHFLRDKSSKVIGIDYKTILCLLREGVENWLQTKKKKSNNN